jgi:hypothetical protein
LNNTAEITLEGLGVKIAPPAVVSGAVMFGLTPAQWITTLTLVYLLMSIGLLVPKYWAIVRDKWIAWQAARKAKKEAKNGSE